MQPIKAEDVLTYRFLSRVRIAPTGDWAAFLVKQADHQGDDYQTDIFLVRLPTGEVRRLTATGKEGPFIWEEGGRSLLFVSRRERPEQGSFLYRIRVDGGEAERAAELPHEIKDLALLDEGRLLYTARVPVGPEEEEGDKTAPCQVLDEIPFWWNGEGFTNRRRVRLFSFHLASGQATPLTEEELEVKDFATREGRVALIARRFPGKAPATDELWWLEEGSNPHCLSRGKHALDAVEFLDRDRLAVLATDMRRHGLGENREVYTVDLAAGSLASLTPGWDRSTGNSVVADCRHGGGPALCTDAGLAYVVITEEHTSRVVAVSPAGEVEPVTAGPGSVDAFAVRAGEVLTVELRPDRLQELYRWAGGQERRLTDLNAGALADRGFSLPEKFPVTAADGTKLDAWILRPPDFDPGRRYPAVLEIHGGPRAAYGEVFFHEMQVLAGAGFAVLFANPRGSSGRGNQFADIRGKYGTVDYEDLMATVDQALQRFPFVDPERLGVLGGSYGGFMTNWIIGHTDRFRAAVSQRSIANWISKFCTTDIGYIFNRDQLGAAPWEPGGADRLWRHSPLRYADRVRTPTLFIHAGEDYRCWLPEGIQMFTSLRYHGVDARLVLFPGENHELSRSGNPRARVRRLREIERWLSRHLQEG
ncbi:MAG: S9 family peptidase [Candidatus Bipolaricaulaceae bacterium]